MNLIILMDLLVDLILKDAQRMTRLGCSAINFKDKSLDCSDEVYSIFCFPMELN